MVNFYLVKLLLQFGFLGLKLVVDSKAIMPLIGTQMDYTETELNSEFVFNNPNVKDQCGCGQSFSV